MAKITLPRVTLNNVNAAIKAAGGEQELVRGNGYFYFVGGGALTWPASSVYVNHLTTFTVAEWVGEWQYLQKLAR
jgi:hypothetical protein